jgi:hypothetical protein
MLFWGGFTAALLLCFSGMLLAASGDQGLLEIRIKDHREAIGDFSRVTLTLGKISVSPKPGLAFWKIGWQDLVPSVAAIDLTKYAGKDSVTVYNAMTNAGAFDAIQLKLSGIQGVLKKTQRQAPIKNSLTPIKLAFLVEPKGKTVIMLDLVVLDMSDHPPAGYELAIKGYEVYTNGKLVDKVPPG